MTIFPGQPENRSTVQYYGVEMIAKDRAGAEVEPVRVASCRYIVREIWDDPESRSTPPAPACFIAAWAGTRAVASKTDFRTGT